jgi:hypothetical protein
MVCKIINKNKMKRSKFLVLGLILSLTSCADTEIETTPILREKAVVVTTLYTPSEHRTEIRRTMVDHGGFTGTDYNGNTGVKLGRNHQLTTTTIPERFGVAFQCEHGTFTVEGKETKHRVLHDKLIASIGDTVTILYQEHYIRTYEKVNGIRKLVKRELYDMDFLDAQK